MEHNNESGSSERQNLLVDEPLHNDKMVGSQSSYSDSFSSSNHFEVDIGENDMMSPEQQAGGVISTDVDVLSGSPKQSPPVQVMDYNLNRIPSSKCPRKRRNDSEWSLASNESLFSIHIGNESFGMSKSDDINWIDDYSCYTPDASKSSMSPGLPTVIDTSAENERMSASTNGESGEKEEVEKASLAIPTRNSFAFPVLAVESPKKVETENPQPQSTAPTTKAPSTAPKAGGNQWFRRFSCFPVCC